MKAYWAARRAAKVNGAGEGARPETAGHNREPSRKSAQIEVRSPGRVVGEDYCTDSSTFRKLEYGSACQLSADTAPSAREISDTLCAVSTSGAS